MFSMPSGRPLLTLRAIVFDGWLLWKDALPMDVELWPLLDQPVVDRITALAKALHAVFDDTPASRLLDDSPYNVARWWDPTAQPEEPPLLLEPTATALPAVDPTWDGGRVMLRRRGYTADQVLSKIKGAPQLEGLAVTQQWVELHLPQPSSD